MTRFILKLIRLVSIIPRFVVARRSWMQALAGVIALGLGCWGWDIKLPAKDFTGYVNNLFRTIQLITLQFPTNFDGTIPWQLHVARLAVPVIAAMATLNVLVGAITRPVRLALLPHMRNHVVVCGEAQMTEKALITLAERGVQVVAISPEVSDVRRDTLEGYGLTVIQADPFDIATISAINLAKAGAIFLTLKEDLSNLNLAVLAIEAASKRDISQPPLVLAVMVENETLARELDSTLDGLSRNHCIRYHRMCSDREGVRLELERHAPALTKTDKQQRSHLLIVGLSGGWQQVMSQAMIAAQDHAYESPHFTLIVDEAEEIEFEAWRASRPEIDQIAEFEIILSGTNTFYEAEQSFYEPEKRAAIDMAIIMKDDESSISIMLALRRPGNPFCIETAPILVHQSREDRILERLATTRLNDRNLSGVAPFGGMIRPEMIERVLDGKGDRMAKAMHAFYLDKGHGENATSASSSIAWDALPENLRDANRASTSHAPLLFASAGFELKTNTSMAEPAVFNEQDMEWLARVEHKRWCADRMDRGWRYGVVRDDRLKRHSSMIPYDQLPEHEKQKDKDAVLALVTILKSENIIITRREGTVL